MTEKLTPVSRALIAASKMPAPQARRVLMLICESGMTMEKPVLQEPTEGEKHFAKREKFIQRMDATCKRVIKYAKHETLRKIEKHFRETAAIQSAEGDTASLEPKPSLAARLTFDKSVLSEELLAALAEEQTIALGIAGQQLFDEIGRDSVWRIPSQDAIKFIAVRANLLANVPDEIHRDIMQSIEQGLQGGESRRQLMARISTAFDEIGRSRSETIANTETAAAFNYSRDKAMREAGVTHKRWLHSMSPLIKEPRPTHVEADGQVQPIDDPFDVGGVLFMRPADDSLGAGPEDIINCHCVSIAVEAPIESGDLPGHPFRGNQWIDRNEAADVLASHKDRIVTDKEKIKDQWLPSDKFHLMEVPTDSVFPAQAVRPLDKSYATGPIIVDENTQGVGRHLGKFGEAPDALIVDGKHRHAEAIARGDKTIMAYVGDKIKPKLEAKMAAHLKSTSAINDAKQEYLSNPSGSTLRKLRSVATEAEVEAIRKSRKTT